ncbi:vestigial like 4 like [Denticeps clupeoides]|uniref:Transcription cofactor vestigial-like protein 4 n=1 Tax=Denticeps clupeoides TaxID=299321 RepID=A0AAY4ERA7_9TELE|nr:transcription cofactor vestigial-like protein 4 [Denticeps clupeoides]
MAVTNFHYITRMSSGFKVYILEGQPSLRSEDRYRPVTSDRMRVLPAHQIRRKNSSERGLTLEERRMKVHSRTIAGVVRRASVLSEPDSLGSSWSRTSSPATPTTPLSNVAFPSPVMDEPLALIKKPRRDNEVTEEKTRSSSISQIQSRPSVITCVSSTTKSSRRSENCCSHITVMSEQNCDHVEEHFKRSLGMDYHKATSQQQLSINVSVDDHFAKALGEKWHQLKASSSSCSSSPTSTSSSPPSSPSLANSPRFVQSPSSPTTSTQSLLWPIK